MNRTYKYEEFGVKIIRRDFNVNKNNPEKSLINFINDMIEKGLISSSILLNLIKNESGESIKESKILLKDSFLDTCKDFKLVKK